eukprot:459367-Rhodomonas_salina.1
MEDQHGRGKVGAEPDTTWHCAAETQGHPAACCGGGSARIRQHDGCAHGSERHKHHVTRHCDAGKRGAVGFY